MATAATKTEYTPEDLLAMPDGDRYELVDGRLVERTMGALSSWVGWRLGHLIGNFNDRQPSGWVLPADAGYQCFPDAPAKVRKPDVSFIRLGRLPGEQLPEGNILLPPDLAVEIISPNDLAYEVDHKVEEYLRAGVPLVWVVNPETRTVRVHHSDRRGFVLRDTDELTGEGVLPGFRCLVQTIFLPPSEAEPTS
jgi:Uma2 family endonuclease